MNYQLFSAFLLITFILVIVPGPIVTIRPELDSANFGGSF
jgi:hypothetical protein